MELDDRSVVMVFATMEHVGVAKFKTRRAADEAAKWLREQGHAAVVVDDSDPYSPPPGLW